MPPLVSYTGDRRLAVLQVLPSQASTSINEHECPVSACPKAAGRPSFSDRLFICFISLFIPPCTYCKLYYLGDNTQSYTRVLPN
jgi:hypothetical protein